MVFLEDSLLKEYDVITQFNISDIKTYQEKTLTHISKKCIQIIFTSRLWGFIYV